MSRKSAKAAIAALAILGLTSACATTSNDSGDSTSSGASGDSSVLTVGTTDKVSSIDPAGSYDNGSFMVMNQVYPFLLNTVPGAEDVTPTPDIAASAEFTSDTEYTVVLKPDLTFANGHDLTSSDVKFSFERQLAIADPNGPSSLLGSLDSIDTPDDVTVVFHLKAANDQTWPQVLSSPAGPIVDEEVFPADSILSDDEIVAAEPFAGQYSISSYTLNELVALEPFDGYQGSLGDVKNDGVTITYYKDANNMKLDIQKNAIDVAYRSLSATDVEDLSDDDNVQVVEGPGGEIRYIVFNFDTMPFGAATADADSDKALAVRQAVANLVDRQAIATDVYKDTYSPLYSYVPEGLEGATQDFMTKYGDGEGGPDSDKAAEILAAAGIETPVTLALQYNPDHYGSSSGDEYAAIKSQLESSGLFTVDLQSTEWVQYSKDRVADVYPAYQLGWFPDYSDPDNYLTPFFTADNFLANHYENTEVQSLIAEQVTQADPDERLATLEKIQDLVSDDISTLPLLQGKQVAVAGSDVSGVTLDASFKLRLAGVTK
ncbi:ABC transporter substrate-binding protein [Changpingibacter yushuensis]|uniref:ABC transporter substrate-binding protein n=1 Tax=Changpingibacter yushuensis TaxID=2758440 RepID=UPI0015F6AA57|nr:ABC transporter substrate-binding protein [Changpingibacter yushuensis]